MPNRRRLLALLVLGSLFLASCAAAPRETETLRRLTILHTNDEHGWMESYKGSGGADGLQRRWVRDEGWTPDGPFLVISSGDMWTGPAISTTLAGEPMVDVMNALGYRSATLGNHDFDFGQEAIRLRRQEASFPFLGANIRMRSNGALPDFVDPYTLIDINGIRVGVLGVTTIETPADTRPTNVADLEFRPYKETLEAYVPEMRAAGADLILVAGHICGSEMEALAESAAALGVSLIAGGHCHEEINETIAGVRLIESGSFLQGYTRVDLLVDTAQDRVVDLQAEYKPNRRGAGDPDMAARIASWALKLPPGMLEPLGYVGENIDRQSPEMRRLLVQAWLVADPLSDIALASARYVQQDLLPGVVSEATIIGMLPTENMLVRIELTGEQLRQVLEANRPLAAGVTETPDGYRLADGSLLDAQATYEVLLPDTLYLGGNYYDVARFDSSPTATGIEWRAPTVALLRALGTDRRRPLDQVLAGTAAP
ncbi:MAG: bifunctional metallophosphatase/5'-nucleotidase [Anaerolineales bacterium]|nr:bifunctional metallophosphatase/5'-nucleotidase [Anaerolineales bacterium]